MQPKLSRRAILRGAGGAALGLPLLELTSGRAFGHAPPRRLLLLSVAHSVDVKNGVNSWLPAPGAWDRLSPVLEPLIPHRDKLLVLSGLDNAVHNWGPIGTDGHCLASHSLLTCRPPQDALDAKGDLIPRATLDAGKISALPKSRPSGPSFEYFLADALKDQVLNLRVGEAPDAHRRSYRTDLTADDGNPNPVAAFNQLFGARQPTTMSPADRLRGKRKSILDAVKSDFDKVVQRAGAEDRVRLRQHAEHVRTFERGLDEMVNVVCDSPKLNTPLPLPTAANVFTQSEGAKDDAIAAAQIELAVTAFACQATRVAHIHFSNGNYNTFPWLNGGAPLITDGWHGWIHLARGNEAVLLRTFQWYSKVMADALTRLEQTPEGTGTLLDNTLVVWLSPLRTSGHGTRDLPVVIGGKPGGALIRPGRHLTYTNRTIADLYTTLLNVYGVPAQSFGWNTGTWDKGRPFNSGPLAGWI